MSEHDDLKALFEKLLENPPEPRSYESIRRLIELEEIAGGEQSQRRPTDGGVPPDPGAAPRRSTRWIPWIVIPTLILGGALLSWWVGWFDSSPTPTTPIATTTTVGGGDGPAQIVRWIRKQACKASGGAWFPLYGGRCYKELPTQLSAPDDSGAGVGSTWCIPIDVTTIDFAAIDEDSDALTDRLALGSEITIDGWIDVDGVVWLWLADLGWVEAQDLASGACRASPSDAVDAGTGLYETSQRSFCVVDIAEDDILNLRTGPGIEFEDIGDVPYDAVGVQTTGRAGLDTNERAWFEVRHGDAQGWVASWYLTPAPCAAATVTTTTAADTTTTVGDTTTVVAGPDTAACLQYGEFPTVEAFAVYLQDQGFNVIFGEDSDEELVGTEFADAIFALGGNDVVRGEEGPDCLFAGDGSDFVFGGPDTDVLLGERGNDWLESGGDPDDYENGGEGTDLCALFEQEAVECEGPAEP